MSREKLTKKEIKSSDLYGFIRRLIRRGFSLDTRWNKSYQIRGSPYPYIRTYWRLVNGNERVLFKISPHKYSLIIWRNDEERLRVTVPTWNWLEKPFLKYFGGNPISCLRRLGRQPKNIRQWLEQHPEKIPQITLRKHFTKQANRALSPRQLKSKANPPNTK